MNTKCGFVAVFGRPNAGKSTLINALVGEKVSIVSKKAQTTRTKILGIYSTDSAQVVLIDTPGIFAPSKALEKKIVTQAKSAKGDFSIWVLDVTKPFEEIPKFITSTKFFVVLNKIDLISDAKLQEYIKSIPPSIKVLPISAVTKAGLDELRQEIETNLPESSFLFDKDEMTDAPAKSYASEITRETIFELLSHELPYEIYVQSESFKNLDNGSIRIQQVIGVAKKSQKLIVVGHKGSMIKEIGTKSRLKMEEALSSKVHLFLFVKVHPNWMENEYVLKELGL